MKRVRGGGGARDQLRDEGIVIFGDYAGDQVLAAALGLPRPGPGEFVSARLAPRPTGDARDRAYAWPGDARDRAYARPGDGGPGDGGPGTAGDRAYARFIRLEGTDWLLASAADPVTPAPALPR
jgi:hypothetical protein